MGWKNCSENRRHNRGSHQGDIMTHKDVSESTQQIMDSFTEQPLVESVISCIGNVYQKDDKKKSESIMDYVRSSCESIKSALP